MTNRVYTEDELNQASRKVSTAKSGMLIRLPFFGIVSSKLETVADLVCDTMATDGKKLFYSPGFVLDNTLEHMILVIIHETLHVVFEHMWRRGSRDPLLWNVATDYAINANIKSMFSEVRGVGGKSASFCSKLEPALDYFLKACLYETKFEGMDAYQIYNILLEEKSQNPNQGQGQGQGQGQVPDGSGNSQSNQGQGPGNAMDKFGSPDNQDNAMDKFGSPDNQGNAMDKFGSVGDCSNAMDKENGPSNHDRWGNKEMTPQEQAMHRATIESAAMQAGSGFVPGAVRDFLGTFKEPKISWQEYLMQFAEPAERDYSFSPPDEMYGDCEFMIPAERFVNDAVKDVYFYVDTSGSVSDDLLVDMASEIKGCFEQFADGTEIYYGCFACEASEPVLLEDPHKMKFEITGGTAPECIFRKLEELDRLDEAKVIIILTDGYFPPIPEELAQGVPVLWFIIPEGQDTALTNWDHVYTID